MLRENDYVFCLISVDCTYDGVVHFVGETFPAGDGCNNW